jgi:hypothetical protein
LEQSLIKAGFEPVGAARPSELGGKHGTRFRRDLSKVLHD